MCRLWCGLLVFRVLNETGVILMVACLSAFWYCLGVYDVFTSAIPNVIPVTGLSSQAKLTSEKNVLVATVKKLNRDVAKVCPCTFMKHSKFDL